jgi:hypothetical protein
MQVYNIICITFCRISLFIFCNELVGFCSVMFPAFTRCIRGLSWYNRVNMFSNLFLCPQFSSWWLNTHPLESMHFMYAILMYEVRKHVLCQEALRKPWVLWKRGTGHTFGAHFGQCIPVLPSTIISVMSRLWNICNMSAWLIGTVPFCLI